MVDYEKRELNKLCKAYNNLYDIKMSLYNNIFTSEQLLDIDSAKDRIEEIINQNGYNIIINNKGNKFILEVKK